MAKKNLPDLRKKLKQAIKNYKSTTGKKFAQGDLDPNVNRSHVNNVASGKSTNDRLRGRIEEFIKVWGGKQ